MAGGSPLLAAHGVSKRYGALAALEDVDFDVERGERPIALAHAAGRQQRRHAGHQLRDHSSAGSRCRE